MQAQEEVLIPLEELYSSNADYVTITKTTEIIGLSSGLKLEASMTGRSFDPALVPTDPGHWKYIYCGCFSINTVPEDEGLVERNDLLI